MLHKYSDGSILKVISSRELVAIPIWKGQRILDKEHAMQIKKSIANNISSLDSGFSIIKYNEESTDGRIIESSYLIDGQHRASVIRDYYETTVCEPDFTVTVTEKTVNSESDAINYFNKINNVKAQQWKLDPNLLINNYIAALEMTFISKKCPLIRNGSTTRPYISTDNLRQAFSNNIHLLKNNPLDIQVFIERVKKYNLSNLNKLAIDLTVASSKDTKLLERTIQCQFTLAYDTKLRWVREILSAP
jgi:hypothetical protein